MDADAVIGAMLADLHRQVHESLDDETGYLLFVGPSDFPSVVHVEGPLDIDAIAAAVLAADVQAPQSAPSDRPSPREEFARTALLTNTNPRENHDGSPTPPDPPADPNPRTELTY